MTQAFDISRHSGSVLDLACDALVIGSVIGHALEGPASEVDKALGGLLAAVVSEEAFEGKDGQRVLVHTHGRLNAKRVVLVGLGKSADDGGRQLGARAARLGRESGFAKVAVAASARVSARSVIEGARLGHYTYDKWRTTESKPSKLKTLTLCMPIPKGERELGEATASAIMLARDLVNEPPATMTPRILADQARWVAESGGLDVTLFDKAALNEKGMRLILAVSAGSSEEPRLIHLTWRPPNVTADTPSVALVGKGITFDAGGLCLKPTGSIEDMKMDMGGAAAVIATMQAIATLKPDLIVHAIVPASENLLGSAAYKLGDVYRSYNGKSVEIMNTDAEGRLVLADALAYAVEQKPREIIDLATLTGAITIALGDETAGVFGNDQALIQEILACGAEAGEALWHMPLDSKLKKQIKSDVADMKNVGKRTGGAITGALFLEEFVGGTKWVHLDIAGPAWSTRNEDTWSKGGTGFGVATLLQYLSRAAARLKG